MAQIIVITGPTAVGKTKLSVRLAQIFNAEIISADSMQVYKGMNVGTAKVTTKEMQGIKHHLLDIKNVDENYSVYDYQKDCRDKIDEILKSGKNVIIAGGTGLYIKAALYNYEFAKEDYIQDYDDLSDEELYRRIMNYDANIEVDRNNRRRLVRYLNKLENNQAISNNSNNLIYPNVKFIGLTIDTEVLYDRINKRVDEMIPNLLKEMETFYKKGIKTKALMTAIGYKELYDYFDKKKTLEECVNLIKKNSRNYAKRQYTWFKNQMNITWFKVNLENYDETIKEVVEYIKNR